jgi:DNA-binding transcriptional regulator YdaS (Cro superfamily)
MSDRDEALQRAINELGGVKQLAEAIGVSGPAISQWGRVPSERVIAVERATGGKVSRQELRPDLYPLERRRGAA